jgi:hypothetical protein
MKSTPMKAFLNCDSVVEMIRLREAKEKYLKGNQRGIYSINAQTLFLICL